MDCSKFVSIVVENLHFLDSLNCLPMSLTTSPKSFDFKWKKGYYPHFFNTAKNLDFVSSYPVPKYYWADCVSGDERAQFPASHEGVKDRILNKKEEMLVCYMDDVNVLRQACCAFRNLF